MRFENAAKGIDEDYAKWVSQDIDKLRAAQDAVDALPDGSAKEVLSFAVLQWMHAAFISHEPLSEKERAFGESVAARVLTSPLEVWADKK